MVSLANVIAEALRDAGPYPITSIEDQAKDVDRAISEQLEQVGFIHEEEDAFFFDLGAGPEGAFEQPDHMPGCSNCRPVYRVRGEL